MTAPVGPWDQLPDERLLEMRPSELGLRLRDSPLERCVRRLRRELSARGFVFRPHCWLSSSWYSPDGIPGIALPFFLAHPRLAELERGQMGEAEGDEDEWCLRILRHEAGHAIDTAYRLYRRKSWRETFGAYGAPYLPTYAPRPLDRRFVLHLDQWYAQSHPAEDFAETFAVWLAAGSDWRREYAGWGALAKLELVDRLMDEVRELPPPVTSAGRCEPVSSMTATLRTHYADRKRARAGHANEFYDRDLGLLFEPESGESRTLQPLASPWLRAAAPEITARMLAADREQSYNIEQVLGGLATRAHELGLAMTERSRATRPGELARTVEDILPRLHDGTIRVTR